MMKETFSDNLFFDEAFELVQKKEIKEKIRAR